MHCALCNELIDQYDIDMGSVQEIDDTFWHVECLEEYTEEQITNYALMD